MPEDGRNTPRLVPSVWNTLFYLHLKSSLSVCFSLYQGHTGKSDNHLPRQLFSTGRPPWRCSFSPKASISGPLFYQTFLRCLSPVYFPCCLVLLPVDCCQNPRYRNRNCLAAAAAPAGTACLAGTASLADSVWFRHRTGQSASRHSKPRK